jgi:muramoyltetrapeptide carboxypeptidase LdcA involved in peptidoglycan recycling
VLASIGGDEITALPYLDPAVVTANPKPFAGYSDNTNLLNWLWHLGLASYHGGSTMVHLGRGGSLHPVIGRIAACGAADRRRRGPAPGRGFQRRLSWTGAIQRLWTGRRRPGRARAGAGTIPTGWSPARPGGGNLEILHWNLAANRWIRPADEYAGCGLLLETSEEMPSAEETFRMLRNAGERGLLAQLPAILVVCRLNSDLS